MLVIVPTYKRLDCLPMVVESILNNTISGIDDRLRLVVANNYPPSSDEVDKLMAAFSSHPNWGRWEVIVHHRATTIPAVENWYNTFYEFAREGEVVVLNGDDDLLPAWSLRSRYNAMKRADTDLLISYAYGGLTYLGSNRLHYGGTLPQENDGIDKTVELTSETFEDYGNVFIGSHTYRFGKNFISVHKYLQEFVEENLEYADYNHRTFMFPYYMVLGYFKLQFKVHGLQQYCCVRGTELSEKLEAPFNASRSWNSGLISLILVDFIEKLDTGNTRLFARSKNINIQEYLKWKWTLSFDNRVPADLYAKLSSRYKFSMSRAAMWFNFKVIAQQWLGLKCVRIRLDKLKKANVYEYDTFIKEIAYIK